MKTFAGRKLSRPSQHRMALLKNLVCSLFLHEKIVTTFPKGKEAARFAEKIISKAKKGGLAATREVSRWIEQEEARRKLLDVIVPRYKDRNGGYTQVLRGSARQGDAATIAVVRLLP